MTKIRAAGAKTFLTFFAEGEKFLGAFP